MHQENVQLLEAGLRSFGIAPAADRVSAVIQHLEMVADWNQRVNLTALKDERDMVLKHAVDSASVVTVVNLEPGTRVADVGTGAGFPGITLKCLHPEIDLTLVESLAKRCKFLEAVGTEVVLPLSGTTEGYRVTWGRAEDVGNNAEFREQFDLVLARAVAELRVLAEFCLPLCRVGGQFVAMKGPAARDELDAANKAIRLLGGEVEEVREILLPEDAGVRSLIRIKKVKVTPKGYPRKAGTPAKQPL